MNRDLGKEFYTQGMHKFYPSCYGNHNLIDCGPDILKEHDVDTDNIQEIIIGVDPAKLNGYGVTPFKKGDAQPAALFYQAYATANVILRKGASLEHFTEEAVQDPKIIEICGKVKHAATTQKDGKLELIVKMKNGKQYSTVYQYGQMRGYPERALSREELLTKYWKNINFCGKIDRSQAEKALDMIENLEKVDNVARLTKLLVV